MSDWASPDFILPRVISSQSGFSGWRELANLGIATNPSSAVWPSANLAIYLPFTIPFSYPVKRVFWANGSVVGHNADFGIYSTGGTRIYHTGSTAQGSTFTVQYTSVDFILSPGRYYMALAMDSGAGTVMRSTTATLLQHLRFGGYLEQATAFALPASATFATVSNTYLPFCGITLDTSGF